MGGVNILPTRDLCNKKRFSSELYGHYRGSPTNREKTEANFCEWKGKSSCCSYFIDIE